MQKLNKLFLFAIISWLLIPCTFALSVTIPQNISKNTSFSVYDLSANKAVYSHSATTPRLIASNMKLVTTYVGLNKLGKDFTWKTQVGYTGIISNGVLNGDLIIKGGGDPNLSSQDLTNLIQSLNIKNVNGNVVYFNDFFIDNPKSSELYPEPYAEYSAEPNGLLINQGLTRVKMTVANNKINLASNQVGNYKLNNSRLQVDSKCNCACPYPDTFVTISAIGNTLYPSGTIPASCDGRNITIYSPQTSIYTVNMLSNILSNLGIKFESILTNQPIKAKITLANTKSSESLGAIIYTMNQQSNNLYAKTIFMTIGLESNYKINYKRAQTNYLATLNKEFKFSELNATDLENGAGLSRHERLTTTHIIQLLNSLYNSPNKNLVMQSLPTPGGTDNTLGREFADYPNMLFVKTGTLSDVKAYSGYFINKKGNVYSVSFVINGLNNQKTKQAQLNNFKSTIQNILNQLNK